MRLVRHQYLAQWIRRGVREFLVDNNSLRRDALSGPHHEHLGHVKGGSRIHVSRCKRIKTTVHFAHQTVEREFAPGIRVRAVKAWAVHELKMDPRDAAEHVLQLCGSTERPSTDTPLIQLVHGHGCEVCFDLVPDKRVEG